MSAPEPTAEPIPNVSVSAATNRAGTVTVRATNQGMPVEVKIERSELRYGAAALAEEILRLCKLATLEAGAKRRELLSKHGMPNDILDRLGLPTRESAATEAEKFGEDDDTPKTWLRPV
jgi:hypothetical protein